MGQQQLLLVLLVVIVVGISTIVAVNVIGITDQNSKRDAVMQDLLKAASNVQAVWNRSETVGGAGKDFTNLDDSHILESLNIPSGSYESGESTLENENGVYYIGEKSEKEISIIGIPKNSNAGFEINLMYNEGNSSWDYTTEEVEI